jgi:hypothetical protein
MMEATATWIVVGLVRRTWLVALAALIGCGLFAAHAVGSLVEARYLDTDAHGPVPPTRPVQVAVAAPARDGSELVARNMFCSTCTPEPGPTESSPAAFVPAATLIATSVGREPSATLHVPATDAQGSYGLGDAVPGIGTVTRIGFVSIDITDAHGAVGTLSLLAPQTPGGRDASAATPAPAAADPFEGRVKKINDTTYEVERSLVRDLVSGTAKTGGARIAPVTKDGKLDGLRLIGVRAGTPAAALGFKNRDVLEAINGTKIESANNLLDFYAQMEKLTSVQLEGTRDGKPLKIELRLR